MKRVKQHKLSCSRGFRGMTHNSSPYTFGHLVLSTMWAKWRFVMTIIAQGYQSLLSLRNWLISSLPTGWTCIIHEVWRVGLCLSVCVGRRRCHRWLELLLRGWCRMDKGEDGLFTKTSDRCWVNLVHLYTLVCKSCGWLSMHKLQLVLKVSVTGVVGR